MPKMTRTKNVLEKEDSDDGVAASEDDEGFDSGVSVAAGTLASTACDSVTSPWLPVRGESCQQCNRFLLVRDFKPDRALKLSVERYLVALGIKRLLDRKLLAVKSGFCDILQYNTTYFARVLNDNVDRRTILTTLLDVFCRVIAMVSWRGDYPAVFRYLPILWTISIPSMTFPKTTWRRGKIHFSRFQ